MKCFSVQPPRNISTQKWRKLHRNRSAFQTTTKWYTLWHEHQRLWHSETVLPLKQSPSYSMPDKIAHSIHWILIISINVVSGYRLEMRNPQGFSKFHRSYLLGWLHFSLLDPSYAFFFNETFLKQSGSLTNPWRCWVWYHIVLLHVPERRKNISWDLDVWPRGLIILVGSSQYVDPACLWLQGPLHGVGIACPCPLQYPAEC